MLHDALFRIPCLNTGCDTYISGRDLPCGSCRYCVRAGCPWQTFTRKVGRSPMDLLGSTSGVGGGVHTVKMPEEEGISWMGTGGPLVSDMSRV